MFDPIQFKDFAQTQVPEEEKLWAAALHLAPLLNFVFPLLGIMTPIGIWYHHQEKSAFIKDQAKELLNYFLFTLIIGVVMLCMSVPMLLLLPWLAAPFAFVGILFLPLALMPFWAAFNVYQGSLFRYPTPFRFLKHSPGISPVKP